MQGGGTDLACDHEEGEEGPVALDGIDLLHHLPEVNVCGNDNLGTGDLLVDET